MSETGRKLDAEAPGFLPFFSRIIAPAALMRASAMVEIVLGHYEGSREKAARAVGAGAPDFSRPLRAGLTYAAPPALDFLARRRSTERGVWVALAAL